MQRSLRNLKGLLTREINACNDKIGHFKLRFSDDSTTITLVKIGYAQNIIDNHTRCQIRFVNFEKALEKLRQLQCDTWEGDDEELDAVLEKLNQDLVSYEHQFQRIARENAEVFEMCNTIITPLNPQSTELVALGRAHLKHCPTSHLKRMS